MKKYSPLKNNQGYALALILALLPVLLGLLFLSSAVMINVRINQQYLHTCRAEGLSGQNLVAPHLKTLLSLNPVSIALRMKKNLARVKMVAAAAAQNYTALAKATAEFNKAMDNLRKLDAQQKQLIQQSNLLLEITHRVTQLRLRKDGSRNKQLGILESTFTLKNANAPKLAVRPDDADLAPTYSLEDNFEEKQALAQSWQYTLGVIRPLRRFLSGEFRFEKSCSITLKEENKTWQPKVKKDKSS